MYRALANSLRLGFLSLALTLAVTGIVGGQGNAPGGVNPDVARTSETRSDRGSDWNWIGLFGLAGLAGLAGLLGRNGNARHHEAGALGGTAARH